VKKGSFISLILLCSLLCISCSTTRQAANFNGLSTPEGRPIAHLSTSNLAIHLLGTMPLVGDASLTGTVDNFTQVAKMKNASKVRIVQSSVFSWWFVFPPFSFVLTPVSSNVAGDALE
jgi:hypothetical protein